MDVILRKRIFLLIALPLIAAPGSYCKWQGPGTYFKAFDTNKDGVISREEWDHLYDELNGKGCCYEDFEKGDCNKDGSFTWSEYYDLRFSHKSCSAE